MSKQEFVNRLRISLSGKVSPALVEENARYYEEYINTQIRLGQREETVLESLGDPRLIARSIVVAESVKGPGAGDADREYDGRETKAEGERNVRRFSHIANLPAWALPVLAGGVMFLLLAALGLVFGMILRMLAWLWPIIAIAMIVIFFVKLFRDWLH